MAIRVMVTGASGMLGSTVTDVLAREKGLEVTASVRRRELIPRYRELIPNVKWLYYDVDSLEPPPDLENHDWLINAIGITKPFIHDGNAVEVKKAIMINALLPFKFADWTSKHNVSVIQIATDCVFSGRRGMYDESDLHDCLDVYGKTKSLGEVCSEYYYHIRTSIIGREPKARSSYLLEWFLSQPPGASVSGYTNHRWNGLTTLQFAKICSAIVKDKVSPPHLQHIVPTGHVFKSDLLALFAEKFEVQDVTIEPVETPTAIDRTLTTKNQEINRQIWQAAGYLEPPSVAQMISEFSDFDLRLIR